MMIGNISYELISNDRKKKIPIKYSFCLPKRFKKYLCPI